MRGMERSGTVLLVEDQPLAASALARYLRRSFVDVVVSGTAGDALSALRRQAFELILADIGLPDASGFDVLIAAREEQPFATRAVLTGGFDRDLVHRVALLGATFMNKPAPRNVLDSVVERARRRRGARSVVPRHVARWASESRLSPRERDILSWLVWGGTREGYCLHHAIAPSTFETHAKRLRAKVPIGGSMNAIVHRILLDVIRAECEYPD
jgi:DNA-binding NarL/FixJ family response regulator